MPSPTYDRFVDHVRSCGILHTIASLLDWDQETYMPPAGAAHRAAQMSVIAGITHERFASDETGRMLEALERDGVEDGVARANVRETRRNYDRAVKLPTTLVREIASATTIAKEAWGKARRDSDFNTFAPHLEKLLDLKRQVAERIGYTTEPYDALMDEYEPGAKAAEVQQVFDALRPELVRLVHAIRDAKRQPDTTVLKRRCPVPEQQEFCHELAASIGFSFEAGRIDTTKHPFCSGFHPSDVRLTCRYDENYLPMSIFGMLHEAGHGLYEQGLDPAQAGLPAGAAASLGIHESQSRMWENFVGRSRAFWEFFLPRMQTRFPTTADISLDAWHFAVNHVSPSLIRVEADEVTYPLHIMLRFDLERQMLSGRLSVRDVPQAWNEAMRATVGVTPESDANGCLQDIHWSLGIFGYFPTYALGNLYAAQFYDRAKAELGDLDANYRRGQFAPLREWLRERIHIRGQQLRPRELVKTVTGEDLSHAPFVAYLNAKFRPLYGLGER